MRILLFATHFKPEIGGVGEFTHQLAREFHRLDQDLLVLADSADDGSHVAFDRSVDYRIQRLPRRLIYEKKDPMEYAELFWEMLKKTWSWSPDVLLMNYIVPNAPCRLMSTVARLGGIPSFLVAYGEGFRHRSPSPLGWDIKRAYVLSLVDQVFVISSHTKKMLSRYGCPASKIKVVHPGVDVSKWASFDPDPSEYEDLRGSPMLLSVGRLVEHKGFDRSIRAVDRLKNDFQDLHYYVVGKGPYEDFLRDLVVDRALGDHVTFVGYVSERKKMTLYDRADIFLMPSRRETMVEGFGMTFIEANLFETPVVAGDSGGQRDAVVHGETGFLVDPTDVRDIVRHVKLLVDDSQLSRALGSRGRRRVVEKFDWSSRAREFLETIDEVRFT